MKWLPKKNRNIKLDENKIKKMLYWGSNIQQYVLDLALENQKYARLYTVCHPLTCQTVKAASKLVNIEGLTPLQVVYHVSDLTI